MLRLPATPDSLLRDVIQPALLVFPSDMATSAAMCHLIAIASQQSGLSTRRQLVNVGTQAHPRGPGRGLWSAEQGAVRTVKQHEATEDLFVMVCRLARVSHDVRSAHTALERPEHDQLACQLARLLLATHPKPLPPARYTAVEEAFEYYTWLWHPVANTSPDGRADEYERFAPHWRAAVEAVS